MKGYQAQITFNPEWAAYSFKYFEKKEDAEKYADEQLAYEEKMLGKKGFKRIVELEILKCPNSYCENYMEPGDRECLRCDKIRFDAEQEHWAELREDAEIEANYHSH